MTKAKAEGETRDLDYWTEQIIKAIFEGTNGKVKVITDLGLN